MFANVAWNDLYSLLSIRQRIDYRKPAFKRFNGNNQATLFPNLVNFRPIILEFTLFKRTIFATIYPLFDDNLYSSRGRFQTDWKIETLISAE